MEDHTKPGGTAGEYILSQQIFGTGFYFVREVKDESETMASLLHYLN